MHASLEFVSATGVSRREIAIRDLVIAGWTGRDREALMAHVEELKALGVTPPSAIPLFYRASASRLTSAAEIEVCGDRSSGEVEFVLVVTDGEIWVGAGSDHTDRAVESYSVAVSKQMCDKVLAPRLWRYAELEPHWDQLVLRSFSVSGSNRTLYQEGKVSAMMHPRDLLGRYFGGAGPADGTVMFGGTLAAIGGIRSAEMFDFELEDPVLGRIIRHGYRVRVLPMVA